jgi:hydrogenase maturation protein HypF
VSTYHIHISGIVQGVGFRPCVYRWAIQHGLKGTVCNAADGVHIILNVIPERAHLILKEIINIAPVKSIITGAEIKKVESQKFDDFSIMESSAHQDIKVLLTPDYAICKECLNDINSNKNRRKDYAFTTCTVCGPRYSIIDRLPYDRENTAMTSFNMCPSCKKEYHDVDNRRYYSQTNSCPDCAVELRMEDAKTGEMVKGSTEVMIRKTVEAWAQGKKVAIKGIGGYLITCDATNEEAIVQLRRMKNRPTKPLAVMYHDFLMMAEDVDVDAQAMLLLQSDAAPIVLLPKKKDPWSSIAFEAVAPGLHKVGVMLPYTPLYALLLKHYSKPIVATSGNLSGDPIEYINEDAAENLRGIVDLLLHNNRRIVTPQDDSVMNISPIKRKRIIVRRSRGLAPALIQQSPLSLDNCILSMGGLLKSSFGLSVHGQVYISQYLGDTDSYLTQKNYTRVMNHFFNVFDVSPEAIVCDFHPSFYSSMEGQRLSEKWNLPLYKVQHHVAHFYAVLGENMLMEADRKILGIIWDGTGLGDDGHIWGGEFFVFEKGDVDRIDHVPYFDNVAGDKMAKEPRISALSLTEACGIKNMDLSSRFTDQEWMIYQKLLSRPSRVKCSSMGRLFDAVASIVLDFNVQSYEGEAAMYLENCAYDYFSNHVPQWNMSYLTDEDNSVDIIKALISNVVKDKKKGIDAGFISARFHVTLVDYIRRIAEKNEVKDLAFSGGVFQNAWLVDIILILLKKDFNLYFHDKLSPNDENISFGQLIYANYNLDNLKV